MYSCYIYRADKVVKKPADLVCIMLLNLEWHGSSPLFVKNGIIYHLYECHNYGRKYLSRLSVHNHDCTREKCKEETRSFCTDRELIFYFYAIMDKQSQTHQVLDQIIAEWFFLMFIALPFLSTHTSTFQDYVFLETYDYTM